MNYPDNLQFGDFLLFQTVEKGIKSKPIFAVILGEEIFDQTVGFDYCEWTKSFSNSQAVVRTFILWNNNLIVLGHWTKRPTFRELLSAYRKYES